MSCPKLIKLVKAYTYGEVPMEVYREQRRQIVNEFTEDDRAKKPAKSPDPLDTFIASAPEKPALKHKELYLAIAGATLAVILAFVIGIFLFPSKEQETAKTAEQAQPDESSKSAAQRLAENFLHSDQWNEQSINQFILDWEILSDEDKQEAHHAPWLEQFKAAVQDHLDMEKNSSSQPNQLNEDLLTTLLATVDPGYFIDGAFFGQTAVAQAQGSQSQPTNANISANAPTAGTTPTTASTAPSSKTETKTKAEKAAQESTAEKQQPKEQIAMKQSSLPNKSKAKTSQPAQKHQQVAKAVQIDQVNKVLNSFVVNFEQGNLNKLMKLFAPNATTNHHTSADEISASYAELFQTTNKRDLEFSNFSWKPEGQQMEGNGKYMAHLNPKGTNIEQVFSADVKIVLDTTKTPARITGLYLANQQFSTSLSPSVKAAIPSAQTQPPPTKEELRNLLQDFVTSYNRGDLDKLMALFSQEARTNDRTNISQIRSDYEQLFQTTKSREIVLSDVTWKFNQNKAVASGLFEAKIQPLRDHQINVFRGKIRIAVTKFEGGILITQLLHNTQ